MVVFNLFLLEAVFMLFYDFIVVWVIFNFKGVEVCYIIDGMFLGFGLFFFLDFFIL